MAFNRVVIVVTFSDTFPLTPSNSSSKVPLIYMFISQSLFILFFLFLKMFLILPSALVCVVIYGGRLRFVLLGVLTEQLPTLCPAWCDANAVQPRAAAAPPD